MNVMLVQTGDAEDKYFEVTSEGNVLLSEYF